MPVYQLHCPICKHQFSGMVFSGTRVPECWVCPQCGNENAEIDDTRPPVPHPLESAHGSGCPCCAGISGIRRE